MPYESTSIVPCGTALTHPAIWEASGHAFDDRLVVRVVSLGSSGFGALEARVRHFFLQKFVPARRGAYPRENVRTSRRP